MHGEANGLSNYTNYSWKSTETMALAKRVIEVMDIKPGDRFLDWGCAKGFLVKALRRLGVDAWGHDISEWAIANCDPEVKDYVSITIPHDSYEHVWGKDLHEHLGPRELVNAIDKSLSMATKCIMSIVPLTAVVGGSYIRKEDDMDVTHVVRWPLEAWMLFFQRQVGNQPWIVTGSWHIHGLKPTSLSHLRSCGFIQLTKYETKKDT